MTACQLGNTFASTECNCQEITYNTYRSEIITELYLEVQLKIITDKTLNAAPIYNYSKTHALRIRQEIYVFVFFLSTFSIMSL